MVEPHTPLEPPGGPSKKQAGALREQALGGLAWLTAGRLFAQSMNVVTRIVLARLLEPEAFGKVAMAGIVITFIELLNGQGIAAAVVQAESLDDTKRSTAFWTATIQGFVLAGLAFLAAPLIGWFFEAKDLVLVVEVLLAGSALLAPASVFEAFFAREMNFRSVAVRRILANIGAAVLAIALAYSGAGLWALVAQRLLAGSLFFIMALVASPWKPRMLYSRQALRELSAVSIGTSLSTTLGAMARQVPTIAIGKWLGAEQLGYYTLGRQMLNVPIQYVAAPLTRVMFVLFSRLQGAPDEFLHTYRKGQSTVVVVAAFVPTLMAVGAPVAVPAILGDKWVPAVVLIQILAIPATVRLATTVVGAATRSLGRPRLLVLVAVVPTLLHVIGVLLGLSGGLARAAAGGALGSLVGFAYLVALAALMLKVPLGAQLRPLWVALPPVLGLLTVMQGALWLLHPIPAIPRLLVACLLGTAAYALALRSTGPEEWAWIRARVMAVVRRLREGVARRRRE